MKMIILGRDNGSTIHFYTQVYSCPIPQSNPKNSTGGFCPLSFPWTTLKFFFMKWKERSYHPQASGVDSTCML